MKDPIIEAILKKDRKDLTEEDKDLLYKHAFAAILRVNELLDQIAVNCAAHEAAEREKLLSKTV